MNTFKNKRSPRCFTDFNAALRTTRAACFALTIDLIVHTGKGRKIEREIKMHPEPEVRLFLLRC